MTRVAESLAVLSGRAQEFEALLVAPEAGRVALLLPFVKDVLGYDYYDPRQVIPNFVCTLDAGTSVTADYALLQEGTVRMLVYQVDVWTDLTTATAVVPESANPWLLCDMVVVTNGLQWRFHTKPGKSAVGEQPPFLMVDIREVSPKSVETLYKLHRENAAATKAAQEVNKEKTINALQRALQQKCADPSPEFATGVMELLGAQVLPENGVATFADGVGETMTQDPDHLVEHMQQAIKNVLGEASNKPAAETAESSPAAAEAPAESEPAADSAVTLLPVGQNGAEGSHEELAPVVDLQEAAKKQRALPARVRRAATTLTDDERSVVQAVSAMATSHVESNRITHRVDEECVYIELDDDAARPVAKLYFDDEARTLALFDGDGEEQRHTLTVTDDVYRHFEPIRKAISCWTV